MQPCPPGSIIYDTVAGLEAVVVRLIEDNRYLVVPKYRRRSRLLDTYSAVEVAAASHETGIMRYEPRYGVEAPVIALRGPQWRCLRSFSLEAAIEAGAVLSSLAERGLLDPRCLGLTGSLLAGHWTPGVSDVDLVADLSPQCLPRLQELVEILAERSLRGGERAEWLRREARSRGLGAGLLASLTPPWQRSVVDGVVVSLAIVGREARERPEERFFRPLGGWSVAEFCLEPFEPRLGDYPAVLRTGDTCIVVLDGFYVPGLLEGGCFRAEGPLVEVVERGHDVQRCVSVGGREGGFIERLGGRPGSSL